ncbi:hypothetical protein RN001_000726 [Aquatica leii]|uniref:Uncharacterized protein n=1 Tax=Aquatica leii TaxID=1421715 RepID=A0AAN7PAF9_9COLE|nr:hypothetical protein RN001_000726 [Aquatica leii]
MEDIEFIELNDIDIDEIGSDPIRKFLLHKLKEIQLNNEDLETQINRRKEVLNKCLEKVTTELKQNILEVTNVWQKIFHGKWIIGIEVKNADESGVAQNVDVTLQWDAAASFTYRTNCFNRFKPFASRNEKLPNELAAITKTMEKGNTKTSNFFENECLRSTDIKNIATILVSFPIPEFTDRQNYQLTGILTYEYKTKELHLNISTIEISVSDMHLHDLKKYDIVSGDEKAFLSILAASEEIHLIAEYELNNTSLEKRLEFDCLFKKINIRSKRKSSFFVDCLSEVANDTVIILQQHDDNIYDFLIYARDKSVCQFLLHYIYKLIPTLLILPKEHRHILTEHRELKTLLSQCQSTHDSNFQNKLKGFLKSMEAQMFLVEKFCNKKIDQIPLQDLQNTEEISLKADLNDYQKFRLQLSDLEHQTDLQHRVICNLIESLNIGVEMEVANN